MLSQSVDIWNLRVNEGTLHTEEAILLLSEEERVRAVAFHDAQKRIQYITAHYFVRTVLSDYTNIPPAELIFNKGKNDKPFLKNVPLHFNLSYRSGEIVLAVSDSLEVGIDIEQAINVPDMESFLNTFFTPYERRIILTAKEERRNEIIFNLWTFKESFIKAIGKGIDTYVNRLDFSIFLNQATSTIPGYRSERWSVFLLPSPVGFTSSLAVKGRKPYVNFRSYSKLNSSLSAIIFNLWEG
jgi:4'-phosphopantetheinyl transferase